MFSHELLDIARRPLPWWMKVRLWFSRTYTSIDIGGEFDLAAYVRFKKVGDRFYIVDCGTLSRDNKDLATSANNPSAKSCATCDNIKYFPPSGLCVSCKDDYSNWVPRKTSHVG
jgi:hypothetical protein